MLNRMKAVRTARNRTPHYVVERMKYADTSFNANLLSKMENGLCKPTAWHLAVLSEIYDCTPDELIGPDTPESEQRRRYEANRFIRG